MEAYFSANHFNLFKGKSRITYQSPWDWKRNGWNYTRWKQVSFEQIGLILNISACRFHCKRPISLHKLMSVTLHCSLIRNQKNSPILYGSLRFTKNGAVDMNKVEVLCIVDSSTQMRSFTNYLKSKYTAESCDWNSASVYNIRSPLWLYIYQRMIITCGWKYKFLLP